MKGVSHIINKGDVPPIRTMPYRICPAWRKAIKDEYLIFKTGIIEPSLSSWTSPIVPVMALSVYV